MTNKVAMHSEIKAILVKSEKVAEERKVLIEKIAKCVLAHKTYDAQWTWVREFVGEAIAKHYKVEIKDTRNGTITFTKDDGTRHDTALSALRALLSGTTLMSGSGNTNRSKTDPVDALLKKFNSLTAAQKKRFLASV